jgi:hypothetical protein
MEQWESIRRRVLVEHVSKCQIFSETGMHWQTLEKILEHSIPPGYCAKKARGKPKLGKFLRNRPTNYTLTIPTCGGHA